MLEKEEQQRMNKVKEVEEEIDYLGPYLNRIGNREELTFEEALEVKYACLDDFKKMLLNRANALQDTFDKV